MFTSINGIVENIQRVWEQHKPKGRYRFLMIDTRSHQIMLDEFFFTKVRAIGCLDFHSRITSTGFTYRLMDQKTGKEIFNV